MTVLNPHREIRFSYPIFTIYGVLIVIFAFQFWGYYPNNLPDLRELTIIGEMIREGTLNHPVINYFRLLPINIIFEPDLMRSPGFNFVAGFVIKFTKVICSFLILRFLIANDVAILLLICFFAVGFNIESGSFFLTIKNPSFFHFREIARKSLSLITFGDFLHLQ